MVLRCLLAKSHRNLLECTSEVIRTTTTTVYGTSYGRLEYLPACWETSDSAEGSSSSTFLSLEVSNNRDSESNRPSKSMNHGLYGEIHHTTITSKYLPVDPKA